MTENATPEAQPVKVEYNNDDPFGLNALENLDIEAMKAEEEPQAEEDEPVHEESEDQEPEVEEQEAEDEEVAEEVVDDEQPKKKSGANGRIQSLTNKLKDKDAKLAELEAKLDNVLQGQQYLQQQQNPAKEVSLDDQLSQAAQQAGDASFDLDEYTTDAEKKTALQTYNNQAMLQQQQQMAAIQEVKSEYAQVVEQYKSEDENTANALVAAYNAAVTDEARAIMRRYDGQVNERQAVQYAEQNLLAEAKGKADPITYIAKFGHQILQDAQQYLPKDKKAAKIDHKNREKVKTEAGKPAVDTVSLSAKDKEVNQKFESLDF